MHLLPDDHMAHGQDQVGFAARTEGQAGAVGGEIWQSTPPNSRSRRHGRLRGRSFPRAVPPVPISTRLASANDVGMSAKPGAGISVSSTRAGPTADNGRYVTLRRICPCGAHTSTQARLLHGRRCTRCCGGIGCAAVENPCPVGACCVPQRRATLRTKMG